jgi:hypothetical protein
VKNLKEKPLTEIPKGIEGKNSKENFLCIKEIIT